jgi:hypothetical protein
VKSLYNYIIKPLGKRYNNSVDVDGKSLIVNTEVFNHQYVNREAEILALPINADSELKVGDTVIVHHNVFRRWHDIKGKERNSKAYYREDMYFINKDQIFAYKSKDNWKPMQGFCFVKPIKSINKFDIEVEDKTKGVIKYTDGSFNEGDIVGFEPFSKYEFVIENERLYRVYSKFITIKYEYQGDEEEYNPSWA